MAAKKCFDDQWIVITGGAGFIGSCVIRHLNDLGYESNIIVVDDIEPGARWKNLSGKKFSEVVSPHELRSWLEKNKNDVEAIIHLASTRDKKRLFDVNYRLGTELATYAIDYDVRFIYASSAETYGHGRSGFDDKHEALDSLRQKTPMGGIKHLFDLWALRSKSLEKIVGLKFGHVYGPNEYHKHKHEHSSLVMQAFKQAQKEKKIEIPSFGLKEFCSNDSRDFVYVKDVARIVCEFLFNDVSGIYNISSGVSTSLLEMAEIVKGLMTTPVEIVVQEKGRKEEEEKKTSALKIEKISSVMSPPSTKLEDGIKDYIKNYLMSDDHW